MTDDLFQRAKAHHVAGELLEAESLYRQLLSIDPSSYRAANNLGTVLEEQGRWDEASQAYQQGVAVAPDCFFLHYNLGHAHHRAGRLNDSLKAYMQALQQEPESSETHYNIGNLLSEQGRFASAAEAYRRAIQYNPECKEAHSNLGTALYELQQLDDAATCFRQALAIDPNMPAEYFHLAKTLDSMRRYDEAIEAYEKSLELNPFSATTHAHLVMLLQSLEREFETEQAFQRWRMVLPGDPVAEHLWASWLGEEIPVRAADDYIRTVFDEFAADFDSVLARLNYRAPQLLAARLVELNAPAERSLRILDAGCGTGLCGVLLRTHASWLVGVDLSLGMLEKARLRGIYDELHERELVSHLQSMAQTVDVIVAADTLVYFGELEPVLSAAARVLEEKGLILFTLEALDRQDTSHNYQLHRHGRYSHALEYAGLSLQRAGFDVLLIDPQTLRHEAGQGVRGYVCAARKRG